MTEMLNSLTVKVNGQLADSTGVVFGLSKAEILFCGLMLGGLATALSGLDTWHDLQRPQVIVGVLMQLGASAVSFAAGRASLSEKDT